MENILLKQLYRHTSKILSENNQKDYETFERADRIIIWIVGFAIGVFILLVEKDSIEQCVLPVHEVTALSLVIVILGLIYRVLSFFAMLYMTRVYIAFSSHIEIFTSLVDIPFPREIKDEDTLHDIIDYLKEDFKYENDTKYNNLTPQQQSDLRQLYVNLYTSLTNSNNVEQQLDQYNTTISKYFGVSKKKLIKQSSDNRVNRRAKFYRLLLHLSYGFFFLTLLVFISGTCYVLYKYLLQIEPL